jgi:hypothetical protein
MEKFNRKRIKEETLMRILIAVIGILLQLAFAGFVLFGFRDKTPQDK